MEIPADRLINALRQSPGQWLNRAQIAICLNKNQLNPVEKAALSLLADAGKIEERQVETAAPSGVRYEYRVPTTE